MGGVASYLAHYWPLDGSFEDIVGGSDSTRGFGYTRTDGKVGGGYNFCSRCWAGVNVGFDSSECAVNMWLNRDGDGTHHDFEGLLVYRVAASNCYGLFSTGLDIYVYDGDRSFRFNNVLENDVWVMLTVVYDAGGVSCYKNGSLVGRGEGAMRLYLPAVNTSTEFPVRIGSDAQAENERNFDGIFDEIAIFNVPLSEEDIAWLYNDGNGRSMVGLP